MATPPLTVSVRLHSRDGRGTLAATVVGSGMAFLDATVVNVALPSIGAELHAGLAALQWTVTAYAVTLSALLLLGGVLGDRFGRRRVFLVGVAWFALASLACGLAPTQSALVGARALQGVGAALLTPTSLALLHASFAPGERARAVGAWSGLTGVATALGPFLGGWLIDTAGWRWVFTINLPLALLVVVLALRYVPESSGRQTAGSTAGARGPGIDLPGALLAMVTLAAMSYALISASADASRLPVRPVAVAAVAVVGLAALWLTERRSSHPLLPLSAVRSRLFVAVNGVTLLIYAALGGVTFLLVLMLQVVRGFSPLQAGAALLPTTVMMLALSARAGGLASRIGARLPMTVGALVCAVATIWLAAVGATTSYGEVLAATALFGLGLALTVAPLTATVLAALPDRHAGLAGAVNSMVARIGGLLAVAGLPLLVGLSGAGYADPAQLAPAYRSAMVVCAGLLAAGSLLTALTVRHRVH